MFSQFSNLLPSVRLNFFGSNAPAVKLPPAQGHDIEAAQEKPARALKHLVKLNHANHAIMYNELEFYNHTPHLLSTAYLLGANAEQLNSLYESESKEQEPWTASPSEVATDDWRHFLGHKECQRAFVDFFEDEMVQHGYDWKKAVETYLFSGKEPLVNSLVAGVGHPLIHLGYAYEISSREVAMEALAMAATNYGSIHKYIDDPSYQSNQPHSPDGELTSPLDVLQRIRNDARLDGLFTSPGYSNVSSVLANHSSLITEYLHSWPITQDLTSQFRLAQHASTALFLGTSDKKHNFFFLHIVTTSHALRVLFPIVPAEHHTSLLKQWWLLTVAVYIAQLRPEVDLSRIKGVELRQRDWEWVRKKCMSGDRAGDAHYIKAVRALREMDNTWADRDDGNVCGDGEGYYLKAAVRLIDEFDGWGGFS